MIFSRCCKVAHSWSKCKDAFRFHGCSARVKFHFWLKFNHKSNNFWSKSKDGYFLINTALPKNQVGLSGKSLPIIVNP
jgi:hypothetical protein